MLHDKNLCEKCKFSTTCEKDMQKIFAPIVNKKRRGASMLSLLVFFFAAAMITAQVFFFSNITAEAVKDDREILGVRLQLAKLVEYGKTHLNLCGTNEADYYEFSTKRKSFEQSYNNDTEHLKIYDLSYKYKTRLIKKAGFRDSDFDDGEWKNIAIPDRVFPPIPGHFLIRAYTEVSDKRYLMFQVLVDSDGKIKTYEEIWYNTEK